MPIMPAVGLLTVIVMGTVVVTLKESFSVSDAVKLPSGTVLPVVLAQTCTVVGEFALSAIPLSELAVGDITSVSAGVLTLPSVALLIVSFPPLVSR
jgi:hypothetical protein